VGVGGAAAQGFLGMGRGRIGEVPKMGRTAVGVFHQGRKWHWKRRAALFKCRVFEKTTGE